MPISIHLRSDRKSALDNNERSANAPMAEARERRLVVASGDGDATPVVFIVELVVVELRRRLARLSFSRRFWNCNKRHAFH